MTSTPPSSLARAKRRGALRLDRESQSVRRAAYWIMIFLAARYAIWRAWYAPPALQLSVAALWQWCYLVCELWLISLALRLVGVLRFRIDRRPEADANARWWAPASPPSIAIMIPTCGEPRHVIERSIIGASSQSYENYEVWVLDDAHRPELCELTLERGVHYFARSGHDNAKAGNLNAGLAELARLGRTPDFLVVFDADFVAEPQFLARTLALMKESDVGLVQTPQVFFNRDPNQSAFPDTDRIPEELRYAYDTVQPALDALGLGSCRGTSFLVRTNALAQIGGFATESVLEDELTGQRLRAAGWRMLYLDERLSHGLAPENLEEYFRQRERWCLGFGQIARLQWLRGRGLPFFARCRAAAAFIRWPLSSVLQAVLIVCTPAAYWWFGLLPYQARSIDMLLYGLPILLFFRGYLAWVSEGRHLPIFREAPNLLQVFGLARAATLGLLRPGGHEFAVTRKGLLRRNRVVYWRPLLWMLVVASLTLGTMAFSVLRRSEHGQADLAMVMWSAYAGILTLVGALTCIERPNQRREPRFPGRRRSSALILAGEALPARIRDISCGGVSLEVTGALPEVAMQVHCELPGSAERVLARVVRHDVGNGVALQFETDVTTRATIVRSVFSSGFVAPVLRGSLLAGLAAVFRRLCREAFDLVTNRPGAAR